MAGNLCNVFDVIIDGYQYLQGKRILMKVTRSLVAGGTALAVMFAAAPAVAPVASAQLSSGPVISTLIGIVSQLAGLAIFAAFWGTVYNLSLIHI